MSPNQKGEELIQKFKSVLLMPACSNYAELEGYQHQTAISCVLVCIKEMFTNNLSSDEVIYWTKVLLYVSESR